jgi:biopolymer transport protein ExbB/TolQ
MAQMLTGHAKRTLSATSMRTLLDSIRTRLEESRDISRYLIGLLIFLGLLGTFWGLMQTVSSVSGVVSQLAVDSGDVEAVFELLKKNLQKPLGGMGVAFSSSLFGLAGSLVLGFLDLQAAHAQNRFVNELEEWLSGSARLSSGLLGDEFAGGAPAYVQALLEQTVDALEQMQRSRAAEGNLNELTAERLETLGDALVTLSRQLAMHNERLTALAANQNEIPRLLERLSARDHAVSFSEELRAEMRLLNRTIANALNERDG